MKDIVYRSTDGWKLSAKILEAAGDGQQAPPTFLLLHAGGPDHESMLPLARRLSALGTMLLPDIRGYGRSVCADPKRHTWGQYGDDVIALLDLVGAKDAILIGAGIGTTIALRTAVAHPTRVRAAVLIGIEDIEDDEAKERETALLDAFGESIRTQGLEATWNQILGNFPPLVGALVREAIPRADPASIAAAAAIGRDRSFRSVEELHVIAAPLLLFPGGDTRHPVGLAERIAQVVPNSAMAPSDFWYDSNTSEDLAVFLSPHIEEFLTTILHGEPQ